MGPAGSMRFRASEEEWCIGENATQPAARETSPRGMDGPHSDARAPTRRLPAHRTQIPFTMPSPPIPVCAGAMAIAGLLEEEGIPRSGFHDAVFRAAWQEQRDAADPAVLLACLEAGGHDPGLLERAAEKGVEQLTAKTVAAYEKGVFGVPTFVVGEDLYFGADRMEMLASRL